MKRKKHSTSPAAVGKPPEPPFGEKPNGHYDAQNEIYSYVVRDGKYYLPPVIVDPMRELDAKEMGIRRLLEHISAFCAAELSDLTSRKLLWWDRIYDGLGVPPELRTQLWYHRTGYILVKPKETAARDDA